MTSEELLCSTWNSQSQWCYSTGVKTSWCNLWREDRINQSVCLFIYLHSHLSTHWKSNVQMPTLHLMLTIYQKAWTLTSCCGKLEWQPWTTVSSFWGLALLALSIYWTLNQISLSVCSDYLSEGRKEERKGKGRKEGRKEGREGGKGRKEGREGRKEERKGKERKGWKGKEGETI